MKTERKKTNTNTTTKKTKTTTKNIKTKNIKTKKITTKSTKMKLCSLSKKFHPEKNKKTVLVSSDISLTSVVIRQLHLT